MSTGAEIKPTDLRGILKYVPRFQGQTFVIAADGIIVADENFPNILTDIAVLRSLGIKIIIVHGIGHQIEELAKTRKIPITDISGTGAADAATLDLAIRASSRVTHLVIEGLTQNGLKAALTNAIRAVPIGIIKGVDHQFTGRVDRVDKEFLTHLIESQVVPVLNPIGFDREGRPLRINSDLLAAELAEALHATKIIYLTPNEGLEINGKEVDFKQNEYGPDIVNDYALDFITRQKDQPFFLYYPMMLTHSPYDATPDSPDYLKAKSEDGTRKIGHFPDMVAYADKLIGKLIAKLEELKLRENTLVVIMGDNGTGSGTPSRFKGREVTGGKGSSLVWGTHVPGIANWPGQVAAGKVCADMIEAADMLPTICEAAQVAIPADLKLDGRSFLPQLRGEKGNPKDALYVWYNPSGGPKAQYEFAHEARYKLYANGRLFDTVADDREKSPLKDADLSAEARATRMKLQALLDANQGPREEYFLKQSESFNDYREKLDSAPDAKKGKTAKKAAAAAPKAAEADPKVARFKERDADHDGKITHEEFQASMPDKKIAKERFEAHDANHDGHLTLSEFLAPIQ